MISPQKAFLCAHFQTPKNPVIKFWVRGFRALWLGYMYAYHRIYHWLNRKQLVSSVKIFTLPQGYKLALPTDAESHFSLRRYGIYEPLVRRWIEETVRPGMRICELGSNIGETTVDFAWRVGENGRVYAFEIDKNYIQLIKRSLLENRLNNVELFNRAVAPRAVSLGRGYLDFWNSIANFPELNYYASLPLSELFSSRPASAASADSVESVEPVDLFSFFKDKAPIDIFFMDIEGCEIFAIPQILRLAELWNSLPTLCVEFHHEFLSGPQVSEIRELLIRRPYRFEALDYRHVLCVPASRGGRVENSMYFGPARMDSGLTKNNLSITMH